VVDIGLTYLDTSPPTIGTLDEKLEQIWRLGANVLVRFIYFFTVFSFSRLKFFYFLPLFVIKIFFVINAILNIVLWFYSNVRQGV
jgi:hypothetical protein